MPRILLLDTEPYLFSLLKTKLEREGFEVLTEARDCPPDLVILGHHPDHSFKLDDSTPVIVLSSGDGQEERAVSHLKMPFRPNDLIALARQTIVNV
jgi:DNA-binding response OmpR family regulator